MMTPHGNPPGIQDILMPLYAANDPARQWDDAEQLARRSRRLAEAMAEEHGQQADAEVLQVLALVALIAAKIHRDMATRGRIESYLVQAGWPNLKIRELLRSAAQLLSAPTTLEEKLVADALTLSQLGIKGLARALVSAGAKGHGIVPCLADARKTLTRRLFTPAGQRAAAPGRAALRDLLERLEGELDA